MTEPRRDLVLALVLAAAAAALHAPQLDWQLGMTDEGYLAQGVARVLDGQLPYRDFDRTYAPLIYWLHAPLMGPDGVDVAVLRQVALSLLALLTAAAYLLARPLLARVPAVTVALLVVALPPTPNKVFVPLAAILALATCRYLARSTARYRHLLGGVALGLVALLRQDAGGYGLVIAVATVVLLASGKGGSVVRSVGLLALGVALVWGPFLGWMASAGGLAPTLEQLTVGGYRINRALALPFPLPGVMTAELSREGAWAPLVRALFLTPAVSAALAALAIAAAVLARRAGVVHLIAAQWVAMVALLHGQLLHRTDLSHLREILVVGALPLAWLAGRWWAAPPGGLRRGAGRFVASLAALLAIAALAWGGWRYVVAPHRAEARGLLLEEARARVVLPAGKQMTLERLLTAVRSRSAAAEPIFVAPYAPMLYVLAERPNPTRHDLLFPGWSSRPAVLAEVTSSLDAAGVGLVVVDDRAWDGRDDRRFLSYAPGFLAWLDDGFVEVERIATWRLFERHAVTTASQ